MIVYIMNICIFLLSDLSLREVTFLNLVKTLTFLFFTFWAANIGLGLLLPLPEMIVAELLLFITGLLLYYFRPLLGFALVVVEILALGFFYSGLAFVYSWGQALQIDAIIKTMLYIFLLGLTWLITLQLKKIRRASGETTSLLKQLQKYDDQVQLLTLNEFLYRAEATLIAMRRRQEKGFILRVTIDLKGKHFALKTLYQHFAQAALLSIRNNYDLVGKLSDTDMVLLLQNTNPQGTEIVVQRFTEKVCQTLQLPSDIYRIEVNELPETWEEARLLITGTLLPSRKLRKKAGA